MLGRSIFFYLFARVHRHQPPNPHPFNSLNPHFRTGHITGATTPAAPSYAAVSSTKLAAHHLIRRNRLHVVLNTGCGAGAGCELEASTKAAPHLPVFAALSPLPHHCTCGCIVPALARTPLLLNLTACARVICMLAAASGSGGCSGAPSWLLKYIIYEILLRKERKVEATLSFRSLRPLR
jgi:hypothetical protein